MLKSILKQIKANPIEFTPFFLYFMFTVLFILEWIISTYLAYDALRADSAVDFLMNIIYNKLRIPHIFSGLHFAMVTSAMLIYCGLRYRR
jgi:hypothetical protein